MSSKAKATILKHNGKHIVQHYPDSVFPQAGQDHCFNSLPEAMLDFYKHDPRGELAVKPGSLVMFPSRDVMRWQGKYHGFITHDAGKDSDYRWQGVKQANAKAQVESL